MVKIGDYVSPKDKLRTEVRDRAGLDFYTREQLEDELIHLRALIQETWPWVGVAAHRTAAATKKYRDLVKDVANVVKENKREEDDSEPDYWRTNK